jgi:lipooligosaccharide transport system permease protein
MTLLCGVFFPVEQLPPALRTISEFLPLYHAISLVRPLLSGMIPPSLLVHVVVLLAYVVGGLYAALVLARRRLLV